jgi:DNA repair protein RadC
MPLSFPRGKPIGPVRGSAPVDQIFLVQQNTFRKNRIVSTPTPYSPPRLRELAVNERPQERLERLGPGALSDTELLAMLLRSGSRDLDVMALATQIITEAGSLAGMVRWSETDFRKAKGIGKIKALQLITVMEVAKRILQQQTGAQAVLNTPELVFAHFQPIAAGLDVEKFWVLCLNRKNVLLKRVEVTSGTASASLVHPREVFREAIRLGALSIIAVHNHPSGDPSPSSADLQVTRQLKEASRTVGIDLIDHIIVGHPSSDPRGQGFYSFHEAGLL